MPALSPQLKLERCPHCSIDKPNLGSIWSGNTNNHSGTKQRFWRAYGCASCGGVVIAAAHGNGGPVIEYYPTGMSVDENITGKAGKYLEQAISSISSPAGSVMLSAASVDAMLKEKDYIEGSLYSRINKAMDDHLITSEMAQWAHEIRLDANDQRHADEQADLPDEDDAKKCVDFALALAQFLFVLPARVQRGLEEASPSTSPGPNPSSGPPQGLIG